MILTRGLILLVSASLAVLAGCSVPQIVPLDDGPVTYTNQFSHEQETREQRIVVMRDKWPVGVPLQIGVSLPLKAKRSHNDKVLTVDPQFPGSHDATERMYSTSVMCVLMDEAWRSDLHDVGTLPPDATSVKFCVTFADRMIIPFVPTSSTTLVRPVAQVPTIDEAVTPDADPRVTDVLTRNLELQADDQEYRILLAPTFLPRAYDFEFQYMKSPPSQQDRDAVADVSIALRITFRHGEENVAHARFFVRRAHDYGGALIAGDLDRLREGFKNPDGWTIVIESDPEMALLDLAYDSYWSGRIERPMSTLTFKPPRRPQGEVNSVAQDETLKPAG